MIPVTPPFTALGGDQEFPILTVIVLFDKKVANRRRTSELAPFLAKEDKHSW